MKIFVTGATGFIGSNFVNHASRLGHRLVGTKRKDSVPRVSTNEANIEWLECDLGQVEARHFYSVDALVHLSSYGVVTGSNDWHGCFQSNVIDFIKLMNIAIGSSVSRYLICGSCFEYGKSGNRYEFIPVNAPLEPTTAYSASKVSASMASYAMAIEKNLELIIARPFHVYGDGEDSRRFYPQLIEAGVSGGNLDMTLGEQIRDFQHVEQCCEQMMKLLEYKELKQGNPQIFNLGTGIPISLREFAQNQWDRIGAKGNINFGKIPYRENEVFRYVPEVNLPF
jgi:nucleoside-diphosphate-sugar epimerase